MKKILYIAILLQFFLIGCVNSDPLEYKIYYEDGIIDHYYFQKPPQSIAFMSIGFVRYIDHIEVLSGADEVNALFFEIAEGLNKKRIFLQDFTMFSNIEYLDLPGFIFTKDDLSALNNFKKLKMLAFVPDSLAIDTLDLSPLKHLEAMFFSFTFVKDWLKTDPKLLLPESLKYIEISNYPQGANHIINALKAIDRVVILEESIDYKKTQNYPSNFEWLHVNYGKGEKSPFDKMAPKFPDITRGRVQQDEE